MPQGGKYVSLLSTLSVISLHLLAKYLLVSSTVFNIQSAVGKLQTVDCRLLLVAHYLSQSHLSSYFCHGNLRHVLTLFCTFVQYINYRMLIFY